MTIFSSSRTMLTSTTITAGRYSLLFGIGIIVTIDIQFVIFLCCIDVMFDNTNIMTIIPAVNNNNNENNNYATNISNNRHLHKQSQLNNEIQQQHDYQYNDIDDSTNPKKNVIQTLRKAGILENEIQKRYQQLPTDEQIIHLYGTKPIILGIPTSCTQFQNKTWHIKDERMIGTAGMFSTGTNLMTQLLKQNCYIPERYEKYGGNNATKEQLGIRWQVPWGKHTPAKYKYVHSTKSASLINKESIFVVVTVRHPWRWIQSMCKNSYAAKWDHLRQCPNNNINNNNNNMNKDNNAVHSSPNWTNPVTVTYGAGTVVYQSLPHLWNDWYNEYYNILLQKTTTKTADTTNTNNNTTTTNATSSSYPLLMVRMEDLIFHTEQTIEQICTCAGGTMYHTSITNSNNNATTTTTNTTKQRRSFQYIQHSAKASSPRGHDLSIGYMEAYIKYSQPFEYHAGFTIDDYQTTVQTLDTNLMNVFHYTNP